MTEAITGTEFNGENDMSKNEQTHTRRVITPDADVWTRLEHESQAEGTGGEAGFGDDSLTLLEKKPKKKRKKKKRAPKRPEAPKAARAEKPASRQDSFESIAERHRRSQRAQRLFAARVRAAAAFAAAIIILAAVVFLTPIFNVRRITVSGNTVVSAEQVSELIGGVKGTNLFLASKSGMARQLKTIKYINDVEIKKSVIPPTINIAVTEYIPAGYVQNGASYLLLDKDLYVIDTANDFDLNTIPCIIGLKTKKSEIGSALVPENEEAGEAVKLLLRVLSDSGELGNVVSADFSSMNNITFNYQNRITAECGTQTDLEHKLRMFCAVMESGEIDPEDRGTIEFDEKGEAIYTP